MMTSGENRFSATTMRRMPVLAQSAGPQDGGTTVWNDPNDASAGVVACGNCISGSTAGSEAASTVMDLAGAGAAGIEAQWGEQFLGSPNGRVYSRAWANGAGRAYKISSLTKSFGIFGLAAGTAFDLQSMQDGNISGAQFSVNLALGALGEFVPTYAIGSLNVLMINNVYPGGFQGYYEDFFLDPNNALMITGGYDGLH
jgi:hypothetical protein